MVRLGCSSLMPNPVCAHGSYFRDGNVTLNRDIFATKIGRQKNPMGRVESPRNRLLSTTAYWRWW
jgi:hypothetical protein